MTKGVAKNHKIQYGTVKNWCGFLYYRGVEQLAARGAHNPEVAGSSPAPATNMVLGRLLTAQYLLRTRGVAWPNTSPCHGEDRRFESGRVRPRSVFSVFSRIVRGFLYKFETKALAQDLRNVLFFRESSESAFKR